MNVLITGGAGFIGSKLTVKLVEEGHEVTILDNFSPQIHGEDKQGAIDQLQKNFEVKILEGDVRNRNDWLKALRGCDAVVHLAAETGTGQSMYEIEKYMDVNVRGTGILLDLIASKEISIEKVVLASSRALYGEGKYKNDNGDIEYPGQRADENMANAKFECLSCVNGNELSLVPTDEESKLHPTSIYGMTKLYQEQMILEMSELIGFDAVALRYQNVYGPGQSLKNPYTGILSIFSNLLRSGKAVRIFEDGRESRDFVFIEDVVEATYLALVKSLEPKSVFNVGTGIATTVMEVAERLRELYSSESELVVTGNYRVGDIRHNCADISRAQRELGYSPKVSFSEGSQLFAEWVLSQRIERNGYERSLSELKEKGLFK